MQRFKGIEMKVEFVFDGMPCKYFKNNGEWIELDGQVGPFEQWSLELQTAAYKAAGIPVHKVFNHR